jgi:hypothetical protein
MTQYKLKKDVENFDVVDGAFAGRKFVRDKAYGEVPPEEKRKFEEIKPEISGNTGINSVQKPKGTDRRPEVFKKKQAKRSSNSQ